VIIHERAAKLFAVPEHFVSLQENYFACKDYYRGEGGKKIGLTGDDLRSTGMISGDMFVHPDVIEPLTKARNVLLQQGMYMVVSDAFRPQALYELVLTKRQALGMSVKLFNPEQAPHATGFAVDINLVDNRNIPVITRNQKRDGEACCKYGYYSGYNQCTMESVYHRIQILLVDIFKSQGFRLGSKDEYWHFELGNLSAEKRY